MGAVLIVAAALVAGVAGYAWGWLAGKTRAEHPQTCRDRLAAERHAKESWRSRALQLEEERDQKARELTWTAEFLVEELDKVAAGYAPAPMTYAPGLPLALEIAR